MPRTRGGRSNKRSRGRGQSRNEFQEASSSDNPVFMNDSVISEEIVVTDTPDPNPTWPEFLGDFGTVGEMSTLAEEAEIDIEDKSLSCSSFDPFSTENSRSSFWTTEKDLLPSEMLPENLFMDEEPVMGLDIDQGTVDQSITFNDDPQLTLGELLPAKTEKNEEEDDEDRENKYLAGLERKVKKRKPAAKTEETDVPNRIVPLNLYEEDLLFRKLEYLKRNQKSNMQQHRLYCKLRLRRIKRTLRKKTFDFDRLVTRLSGKDVSTCSQATKDAMPIGIVNVLDKFQKNDPCWSTGGGKEVPSFRTRLIGSDGRQPEPFVSPYTKRVLKPFIRRDYESLPLKLKLLESIKNRFNPDDREPRKPIDYCYVRPQHIPAINALCREYFWPGIDLSECLEYPDFSCVVMYGRIVIGFAFMVPDVSYNEAYISYMFTHPEWRGAGIAKFMLYHLIQSCMGKDVTLHVSATNPAMILYQKFGFKVEEFLVDFYDKYLPADSTLCKHALFMRLSR